MHEHSLMLDLMHKLEQLALREGAERVVCVRVHLGALSHFSADHFREHFERAAQGGICEAAALEIEVGTDLTASDADGVSLRSVDLSWANGA